MPGHAESHSAHHVQLEHLLGQAVIAARSADWPAYRLRFSALRDALLEHMRYEEEELFPALPAAPQPAAEAVREQHARLRQHLETLGAAAAEHDPEGCLAEIEELSSLMGAHHAAELGLDPEYGTRRFPGLADAQRAPLDLRGLQPPEPMVRIFEALERAPRAPLRVVLPHEPYPLYGLLRERGFSWQGRPRADGGFELLIEQD